MTALRAREPRQRAAIRTILAVGAGPAAGEPVETARATAKLTGARLIERPLADRRADRAIVAMAQEHAADLIVVDARLHPPADIEQLLRPSLDAGISVLAVTPAVPAPLRIERIGVGFDGGPAAEGALAAAVELIRISGDAVACLDVVYVDDVSSPSDEPDARELTSSRNAMIEWWLEALSDEIPAMVRPLRLVGDPIPALADLSLDLDLLIVGTRSRSRLRRLLDGGVSAGLLGHVRCPLLVVPEL
jgi:nucleotide-binding universal stress UspA family protein